MKVKKSPSEKIFDFLRLSKQYLEENSVTKYQYTKIREHTKCQPYAPVICQDMGIWQTGEDGIVSWNDRFTPDMELAETILDVANYRSSAPAKVKSLVAIYQEKKQQETHPFALNDIFQDLGYANLNEAKRAFLAHGDLFQENKDYEVFSRSAENLNGNVPLNGNNGVGGRPQEIVKMTFECLLRFSMEVKTEKGKIFRTLLHDSFLQLANSNAAYKVIAQQKSKEIEIAEDIKLTIQKFITKQSENLINHINDNLILTEEEDGCAYNPITKQTEAFPVYVENKTPLRNLLIRIVKYMNPSISDENISSLAGIVFPKKLIGNENKHIKGSNDKIENAQSTQAIS
jgi:hypothetical protein